MIRLPAKPKVETIFNQETVRAGPFTFKNDTTFGWYIYQTGLLFALVKYDSNDAQGWQPSVRICGASHLLKTEYCSFGRDEAFETVARWIKAAQSNPDIQPWIDFRPNMEQKP